VIDLFYENKRVAPFLDILLKMFYKCFQYGYRDVVEHGSRHAISTREKGVFQKKAN
jgi:hypothetical protein